MIHVKESLVQSAIVEYLAARKIICFRQNTGVTVAEHAGRKRIIRYGTRGMGDLLAFPVRVVVAHANYIARIPTPLWIECKSSEGKQSPAQKLFQEMVTGHGQMYLVARSIDDVEQYLKKEGL